MPRRKRPLAERRAARAAGLDRFGRPLPRVAGTNPRALRSAGLPGTNGALAPRGTTSNGQGDAAGVSRTPGQLVRPAAGTSDSRPAGRLDASGAGGRTAAETTARDDVDGAPAAPGDRRSPPWDRGSGGIAPATQLHPTDELAVNRAP
jgi:hypothetical protein